MCPLMVSYQISIVIILFCWGGGTGLMEFMRRENHLEAMLDSYISLCFSLCLNIIHKISHAVKEMTFMLVKQTAP